MDWKKLKNPPVQEAVLDLRFLNGSISIEDIKTFCKHFNNDFPEVNQMFIFNVEAKINSALKEKIESKRTINGLRLSNKNKSFIFQLRIDGFTFIKQSPYISWEEIRYEAKSILEKLVSSFPKKLNFTRLALRYVNNFNLEFKKPITSYFKILPTFPNSLANEVEAFAIQLLIPKKEYNLKSRIIFNLTPYSTNQENLYKVMLDIDVFKEVSYDTTRLEQIFSDLDIIRDFKNHIFFQSLTEETLSNF